MPARVVDRRVDERPIPLSFGRLAVLLIVPFMAVLDGFIVTLALPAINQDLRASRAEIEFVIAGYQILYGALLVTGGRLGDVYGRKRLIIAGLSGFTVATALCAGSEGGWALVTVRCCQGGFAALMVPQVVSLLSQDDGDTRSRRLAAFGIALGAGAMAGPILGGLLLSANAAIGWRLVFLVNIPIGVAALLAGARLLPADHLTGSKDIDVLGVGLLLGALLLLFYPMVQGPNAGWPLWAWLCGAAGLALLGMFVWHQARRERNGRQPLLDLRLFDNRAFAVGNVAALVFYGGNVAFFFTLTLYLQQGRGLSPLAAAAMFVALGAGFTAGSFGSAPLIARRGDAVFSTGLVLDGVGLLSMLLSDVAVPSSVQIPALAVALVASGAGQGLVAPRLIGRVLANLPSTTLGAATGVLVTIQQIAGAMGIAVIGLVFFGTARGTVLLRASYRSGFDRSLVCELVACGSAGVLLSFLPKGRGVATSQR